MASTFTPNIQLNEPARGDLSGTWDTAANPNYALLDSCIGAVTTISGAAGSVVLSAAQFQSRMIAFNSTLAASITVTFPTSFIKDYKVFNTCTGSSAFIVTLETTAAGGQVICCPPGDAIDVYNDGTNIKFMNLGRVGSYWDYAGSSVPAWISGCTVPPYLNCDGSQFSATTYPQLAVVMGSTTLPDTRGRVRAALDQSAGRLSSAVAGFSPNAVGAAGGDQNMQSHNHTANVTDPGHSHTIFCLNGNGGAQAAAGGGFAFQITGVSASVTGITVTNSSAGTGTAQNVQPTYVGGLTLVRAA